MAVQRGEIYFVNLNPVQGREQAGHRPVLILSVDAINRLPLVVTVVVGTKGENVTRDYPTNVRVSLAESGLPLETVFLCFQLRSLDSNRFLGPPFLVQCSKEWQRQFATVWGCSVHETRAHRFGLRRLPARGRPVGRVRSRRAQARHRVAD